MAHRGREQGDDPADARMQRLLDAVLLVAGGLELRTVLERIVAAACTLVDARYGALGVIDDDGQGLSAFVHHGIDDETASRIGALPSGHGILGLLIDNPEPLRLDELSQHPDSYGFPSNHPPMNSFLGVPVRIGDRVYGNLYLTEKRGSVGFDDADEQLLVALAAVAGSAISNARLYDDLQQRDAWRGAVVELAQAVVAGTPSGALHELIAGRAAALVEADTALLLGPSRAEDDEAQLRVLASIGNDPPEAGTSWQGTAALAVLASGQPEEVAHSPVLGLPALAIPIRDASGVVAVLVVARATPFTGGEREHLTAFGDQVSLVWAHEQAQSALRQLSKVEERERIGRDLHDTVIQRLFATGLSLQSCIRRLDDVPQVAERVVAAVDDIDATIKEIRSTIFALQSAEDNAGGLRTRLLRVVDELTVILDATPRVRFDGPLDTVVDDSVAGHLVPVLREALTNVAKHARARVVEVEVSVVSDVVRLRVSDDGVGIDPADVGRGVGTVSLRERAEALGGRAETAPRRPGPGTYVLWEVPTG